MELPGFSAPCMQLNSAPSFFGKSTTQLHSSPHFKTSYRKRVRVILPSCSAAQSDSTSTEELVSSGQLESVLSKNSPPHRSFAYVLRELFDPNRNVSSDQILRVHLSEEIVWNNPLFVTRGLKSVNNNVDNLLNFAVDSRVEILDDVVSGNGEAEVSWLYSFLYPLPWGPRVTIAIRTKYQFDAVGLISNVTDTWNVKPLSVIRQIALRLSDALRLWPSPHAETDHGLRKEIDSTSDYKIVSYAAHVEFRVRDDIEPAAEKTVWAIGVLPNESFIGKIRKRESYDAVSPISLRRIAGERFEWAVAMPGSSFGSDITSQEHPMNNACYTMIPERRIAVKRFRGFATRKVFNAQREALLKALIRDGLLSDAKAEDCTRVWSRLYDAKLGFNSKHVPTIATYGFFRGIPRVNEIAIELDDVVS